MANTAVIPVKAIRSGDQATGDVIALGEFRSGDKIDSAYVSGNTEYMQVANVVSTYQTISVERAALANTNSYIATKLDSSSYTAADVLTKIKTVDGSGSGLDADTLDGQHASAFADQGFVFAMSIALG